MRVIKNINNNVALCIDSDGNELVAFGKGIGWKNPPYEMNDLSIVTRTFYDVDYKYLDLIGIIPENIIEVSAQIVEYAKSMLKSELSPNIVFTLADHIHFAIERKNNNLNLTLTTNQDLKTFYPLEMKIAIEALKLIEKLTGTLLPNEEIYGIALHFINAEFNVSTPQDILSSLEVSDFIVELVEKKFSIQVDRDGFSYARFVSHIEYLLKREQRGTIFNSQNSRMFDAMCREFPEIYQCVKQIDFLFQKKYQKKLNDEEMLYLMLHINRLKSREN